MKKEKNYIYYREILHKITIGLLIVAVLFSIASIFYMKKDSEDGVLLLFNSILYIILYIILICNKKKNTNFVGVFGIVTGGLMIFILKSNKSLFGIIYSLLGVFYIIYSLKYLKKLEAGQATLKKK